MATLTRAAFIRQLRGKRIPLHRAQAATDLSRLDWTALDSNNNGYLAGTRELTALFSALDEVDVNGSYHSVATGTSANPTLVGQLIEAVYDLAEDDPNDQTLYLRDTALSQAFPAGLSTDLARGERGLDVVALQYALGRLGHLNDQADGIYGRLTAAGVEAFQSSQQLPVTGTMDVRTLQALDTAVSALDLRTPAEKAPDPLAYLSDFRALGLPELRINSSAERFTWDSPAIQEAFGQFVAPYWEIMKRNRIEGDCKNIALFFVDQFRKQLKEDRFIDLPHPVLGREPEKQWIVATNDKTYGLFTRADDLARTSSITVGRPSYNAAMDIEILDPQHSMLYGINVHYPEISADRVAKSTTRLFDWNPAYDNRGDSIRPEIPVNELQAGHIIFIDHTGDGSFDHTVTVIKVERDDANRARKLVLAVGSYDDVRDYSSATSVEGVGFAIVNVYSEEVVVALDTDGRVIHTEVTYSSEPPYIIDTRYSARTTLMEMKAGGRLIVSRWG